MISVMVQAKRRSGNPIESWEVGHMYRIAQTTYTLEKTCCVVTCTLDLTRPKIAWNISRAAP